MLITVFLIFLFNGGVNGQSLAEFKKLVAEQLTEAFDRIIVLEKGRAVEIKKLKSKDLNNKEEIKSLKSQVEDLINNFAQEKKNKNKKYGTNRVTQRTSGRIAKNHSC